MANEKKGKAYEAFVRLILSDLQAEGAISEQVFWDLRPATMTIDPDLTIGPNKDAPSRLLLVTHSGAAGNSHMKTWRNLGELAEAKVRLPNPPKVFTIAFDSIIKEDLKKLQDASFDGQLVVGDRPYGRNMQLWIDTNLSNLPKDKEAKVDALRQFRAHDANLKTLSDLFKTDVTALLAKQAPAELDALWQNSRQRIVPPAPDAKKTSVRRGIGKLLIFDDLDLAIRLYSRKPVAASEIPSCAFELGLARKFKTGAMPSDDEISAVFSLLKVADIRLIAKDAPIAKMETWLTPLRNLGDAASFHSFLTSNRHRLEKPQSLLAALKQVQLSPKALINKPPETKVNWLYHYICDYIKAASGRSQSLGYAQIVRAIKRDLASVNCFLKSQGIPPIVMRGHSALERGLRDWVNRKDSDQAKGFSEGYQAAVAYILADRLAAIDPNDRPSEAKVKEQAINSNLEKKLLCYRYFNPLETLVCAKLPQAKIRRIRASFAERANTGKLTGETTVLVCKSTVIYCRPAYDSGRDHKKKELCGRAVALRYSWDAAAKAFVQRSGIRKLVLVVDGTWRKSDLEALIAAGWDEIYYPDEMDKLAAAIV